MDKKEQKKAKGKPGSKMKDLRPRSDAKVKGGGSGDVLKGLNVQKSKPAKDDGYIIAGRP